MSAAHAEALRHSGPWTESAYLALPDDDVRIELLDGALLVNPPPSSSHQRLSFRLTAALDAAAPVGFEVLEAVGIRVAEGRVLIPDISVVTKAGADLTIWDPADIALVIEITSPGSVANDRAIKPVFYAAAGIPSYLRIDHRSGMPFAVLEQLVKLDYEEVLRTRPGEPLHLTSPFEVTLDLAKLAVAVRPDDR